MDRMATHDPTFCDITWGAGGTTADLTLEIAGKMQNMVRHKFVTRRHVLCGMQQQPETPGDADDLGHTGLLWIQYPTQIGFVGRFVLRQ